MLARTATLILIAFVAVAAACQDDDEPANGSPTPTAPPAATETALPTETPAPQIRCADLAEQPEQLALLPELSGLLSTSGGVVEPDAIICADLTDDGIDDAVVPVSSGGTAGNIAVFVYGSAGESLTLILRDDGRVRVALEDGALVITKPDCPQNDLGCDPIQLLRTRYGWDGSALVAVDETLEDL